MAYSSNSICRSLSIIVSQCHASRNLCKRILCALCVLTFHQQCHLVAAQLGYQPKVHIQGNKICFWYLDSLLWHYLTTYVTTISTWLASREICLIILLLTKTGSEFESCHFKAGYQKYPWATYLLNDTLHQ